MIKFFRRVWKYLTAGANQKFNEKADPKIQLEQAIVEAQDQHRRLKEQAANVIAQQKQTEMRQHARDRGAREAERQRPPGRPHGRRGRPRPATPPRPTEYTRAAESFANRLIQLEKEVEDLNAMALQTTQASDQAKAAVAQNGQLLQRKLAERQKLLTQLEQAKMQEQMNKAMATLSETVGEDVPTLDEVRDKIEARYAKAKGMAELQGESVEGRMLEVEQAAQNTEAQARLSQIRAQLGLAPAEAEAPPAAAPAEARTGPGPEPRSKRPASDPPTGFCVEIGRPSSRFLRRIGRDARRHEDEVVAVDDLGGCARGSCELRCPAAADTIEAPIRTRPLANTSPSGPATSTASSATKAPRTSTTPAGSSDAPVRLERPAGTLVDDDPTG